MVAIISMTDVVTSSMDEVSSAGVARNLLVRGVHLEDRRRGLFRGKRKAFRAVRDGPDRGGHPLDVADRLRSWSPSRVSGVLPDVVQVPGDERAQLVDPRRDRGHVEDELFEPLQEIVHPAGQFADLVVSCRHRRAG